MSREEIEQMNDYNMDVRTVKRFILDKIRQAKYLDTRVLVREVDIPSRVLKRTMIAVVNGLKGNEDAKIHALSEIRLWGRRNELSTAINHIRDRYILLKIAKRLV